MELLDSETGVPLDTDGIEALSERGATCLCNDVQVSAESVLDALTATGILKFEVVDDKLMHLGACCHVVSRKEDPDFPSIFGVVRLPISDPIPSLVEVCLIRCMHIGYKPSGTPEILRFSIRANSVPQDGKVLLDALSCETETAVHRCTDSSLEEPLYEQNIGRIWRHLSQSYEHNSTKYGFLELFRAAEICFYAGVFKNLENRFFKSPQSSLKEASDAILAENRMIYSVVHATESVSEAEMIATKVNQLRASGNDFAISLFDDFEKRQEKNKADKSWRASCYLYQIRCSIAHAGQTGLVIEDFSGGDALLRAIYHPFEGIVLRATGLSLVDRANL